MSTIWRDHVTVFLTRLLSANLERPCVRHFGKTISPPFWTDHVSAILTRPCPPVWTDCVSTSLDRPCVRHFGETTRPPFWKRKPELPGVACVSLVVVTTPTSLPFSWGGRRRTDGCVQFMLLSTVHVYTHISGSAGSKQTAYTINLYLCPVRGDDKKKIDVMFTKTKGRKDCPGYIYIYPGK